MMPLQDIFLQSIYKCERYMHKPIPSDIRNILNVGAKYNLTFDAPSLSTQHKLRLLAWNHISTTPETKN